MSDSNMQAGEALEYKQELKDYVLGLIAALVLTLAAFGVAIFTNFSTPTKVVSIAVLALIQVVVHFRYFLHVSLEKGRREDLHLILFTALIIFLMVAGTLWILFNLEGRMHGS